MGILMSVMSQHIDYLIGFANWLVNPAPDALVTPYRHNVGEDNADAHLKCQIMGREVAVAITDGKLDFDTYGQKLL